MNRQTILVTGANSGFGKLIALTFARQGYRVFATTLHKDSDSVKEISELSTRENLAIEWLVLDVTQQNDIAAAVKRIAPHGLDILINNAGFGILGPIEAYTVQDVQRQFDTNFFGTVRMIYAFLPLLKKSESPKIINISSIAGVLVAPAYGLYASSKHALEVFTEVLRLELFDTNISVSLVEPGGFDTNFTANAQGLSDKSTTVEMPKWYAHALAFRNKRVGTENNIINKKRDPQLVADLVLRIARAKKPRLRHFIGGGTLFGYWLRRFLPDAVWERVAKAALRYFSK